MGDLLASKYQLLRLLGQGGMGTVYEALHVQIGKTVAVKCLDRKFAHDEGIASRFVREAQAAAAVGHRNIIDIYDIGVGDDGTPFLVMEYLSGESLGATLKRLKVLSVAESSYITCQVLSALAATHSKGIVHRDLKPDNIFLVDSPQWPPDIKLLDFGISKMVDQQQPEQRLTVTGSLYGTPYYMAPEQIRNFKDVDQRADLWAMGVILYQCVTGEIPFKGGDYYELFGNILSANLQSPMACRPDLPSAFCDVILKSLQREREDRYSGATEMWQALTPLVERDSIPRLILPPMVGGPLKADWRDDSGTLVNPLGPPAGVVPVLPPTAPAAAYPSSAGGGPSKVISEVSLSPGSVTPSVPHRSRTNAILGALVAVLLLCVVGATYFFATRGGDTPTPAPAADTTAPSTSTEAASAPDEDVVTISLTGVPEDATVLLQGVEFDGSNIPLPRSKILQEVEVRAPGRVPWKRLIAPDQNRSYAVELPPEAEQVAAGAPVTPPASSRRLSQDHRQAPPNSPGDTGRIDRMDQPTTSVSANSSHAEVDVPRQPAVEDRVPVTPAHPTAEPNPPAGPTPPSPDSPFATKQRSGRWRPWADELSSH